ncbi:MAG: conjugal transfer protein TraX, partial [Clostridiales Family XIII bacterium]|nr:conjugal transfer protein TraX [Clostridiales Family XIII bacterium]
MNDDFRGKDAAPGLTRVSEKDMAGGLPDGRRAWQCLSGGALKLIGAAMMVVDHLHQMFYNVWAPDWFTCIGRPVAAMFLFMSAEGFAHTRSKGRYLLRLFIGFEFMGLVSYLLSRALPNENVVLMNNIFGTLLLAAVYMLLTDWLKEGFKKRKPLLVLSAAALMVLIVAASVGMMLLMNAPALPHLALALLVSCAPNVILTEGGFPLVLLGVLFYLLRKHRLAQMAVV